MEEVNNLLALVTGENLNFYQRGLASNEYYKLVQEIEELKIDNKKRTSFIDALEQELCVEAKKITALEKEIAFLFYRGEKHINDINEQLYNVTKLRSKSPTKEYAQLTGEIDALNSVKQRWNNFKRN